MSSTPEWAKKEDYAYLNELKTKGWAWEFIRRSAAYRSAYASFSSLQKQFGEDWRKKQKYDISVPEKLSTESTNAWRLRATDLGLTAETISASQQCARKYNALLARVAEIGATDLDAEAPTEKSTETKTKSKPAKKAKK